MSKITATKTEFFTAYEAELKHAYPWTDDAARLERYMNSVRDTVAGPATTWNSKGTVVTYVWQMIGGKGQPTLKELRGLK